MMARSYPTVPVQYYWYHDISLSNEMRYIPTRDKMLGTCSWFKSKTWRAFFVQSSSATSFCLHYLKCTLTVNMLTLASQSTWHHMTSSVITGP